MGGRGASSSVAKGKSSNAKKAITEEEFLARKGVKDSTSGWVLDKMKGNRQLKTVRGRKRFEKEAAQAEKQYQEKRNKAKEEYRKLVDSGKIRNKTTIEKAMDRAKGHPDNTATQAARRMLAKRGIDWKTGKKIKK